MLNIGVVEPTDTYDESPVFVLTKIVAVIAGTYLGGKTASLLGRLFQKLNWTGWVNFAKDRAHVVGPRGRWQMTLDPSRPYVMRGAAHSSTEPSTDKQGKPLKRGFNVFLRVEQDGRFFVLKTSVSRAGTPGDLAGLPLEQLTEPWKDERLITMDGRTFRHVLKRLQDWQ